ncbi:MAG TPA: proton-conducting transporter membrane subunit [Clostridiales bacterium]|jgi:hydrogenase-4 component F|nr:proton-conducting transporter membrane subunit [Clostridiales bacterium]HQP70619.1 proton-conducting transporter membrane subunit [Clostridiales bacterium]
MILNLFFIISALLGFSIFFSKSKTLTKIIVIFFGILHISFTVYTWTRIGITDLIYFTYDNLAVLFLSILSIIVTAVIYHGFIYVSKDALRKYNIYHSSLILLVTCMTGAYLSNNLAALWIFAEATTLAVAGLIYHDRTTVSLEATWKYVFLSSVGITLAFIGILFISMMMNGTPYNDLSFASISEVAVNAKPLYLKIAFLFIFVGFGTKMEIFPMHTIGIDANAVAPSPIGALISSGLVNMGFITLLRVYGALSGSDIFEWMNKILIIVGLLSLLTAAGYMLKAKHLKRMFAYSTLENMGLVAIALGVGGNGYYAAILLLILHSFIKSSLFIQMNQLYRVQGTLWLDNSGRYLKTFPAGALVLIIGAVSIMAFPPSGLFLTEMMIFKALVLNGNWFVLISAAFLLCCIIYATTIRVMHVVFSPPREKPDFVADEKVSPYETVSQYIFLTIIIVLCFYQPPFLKGMIEQTVKILFN